MIIKHLENKIRLVGIICTAFLVGCVIISVSSIWTARTMVSDTQKKVYVLDGNVPILVNRTTMEETLDVEAKRNVEMLHQYLFTLPPDDKYIKYTMEKAMYLVWRNITLLRRKVFPPTSSARVPCSRFIVTASALTRAPWSSPITAASESNAEATS